MTATGTVEVIFTDEILFPKNFSQIIKESQSSIDPILEIIMIEPGNIISDNL